MSTLQAQFHICQKDGKTAQHVKGKNLFEVKNLKQVAETKCTIVKLYLKLTGYLLDKLFGKSKLQCIGEFLSKIGVLLL